MSGFNNEKGYTLLITLILVVLFLLVTASFTLAAMNQSKQIERTDDFFVATSLAEMGAEITKTRVSQEFQTLITTYKSCLTQPGKSEVLCRTTLLNTLSSDPAIVGVSKEFGNNRSYSISKHSQDNNSSKITYKSSGKASENTKDILLTIDFHEAVLTMVSNHDLASNPILNNSSKSIFNDSLANCLANVSCKEKLDDNKIYYYNIKPSTINLVNGTAGNPTTYLFNFSVQFDQLFNKSSVSNINLYTFDNFSINFDKFVAMNNLNIETKTLIFNHNSESQTAIVGSTLIADKIQINGSNVTLPIDNTKVCLREYSESVIQLINPKNTDSESLNKIKLYLQVNSPSAIKTEIHTYVDKPNQFNVKSYGGTRYYVTEEGFKENCTIKAKEFPANLETSPPLVDAIIYD